jgi:hypothetical protein
MNVTVTVTIITITIPCIQLQLQLHCIAFVCICLFGLIFISNSYSYSYSYSYSWLGLTIGCCSGLRKSNQYGTLRGQYFLTMLQYTYLYRYTNVVGDFLLVWTSKDTARPTR